MTDIVAKRVAEIGTEIALRPLDSTSVFVATGPDTITVRAGTKFLIAGTPVMFSDDLELVMPELVPGGDYVIVLGAGDVPVVQAWTDEPLPVLGGFHYAPGGNAEGRQGGDTTPAINPMSVWDKAFRPACPDPRGMAFVAAIPGSAWVKPFWVDIYLLNTVHLSAGTSAFGLEIADGRDHKPKLANGERVKKLDYATAKAIMEGHGKGLLSLPEFWAAAFGVSERTSADSKPELTGLDDARTSRCGMMQASGNLYVWGHDGDLDDPRASLFGGSWVPGEFAGSRYADVDYWPDYSYEWIGARGRSDHLQPE